MTYLPQLVNWLLNNSSSSSSSSEYYEKDEKSESDPSINDDVVSCDPLADIDSVALFAADDNPPSSSTSSKRRRSDENDNDESAKRTRSQKRVWTKEDELDLLNGFLDYTNRTRIVLIDGRRKNQRDQISSFYKDHVSPELKLRFSQNQTVEKLRRLKRKYHNSLIRNDDDFVADFRFKSPHDRATFGISHEIWRRSADTMRRFGTGSEDTTTVVGDNATMKITRSQARAGLKRSGIDYSSDMRELVMGLGLNYPVGLIKFCGDDHKVKDGILIDGGDEKWKLEEQIVEFEVYLKRLDLVQAKVKAALDKLRSKLFE